MINPAARDPTIWRILDLFDWDAVNARFGAPVSFFLVLKRVVVFSRGGAYIEKVYFPPSADDQDLIFVADRLPNLIYLSLPNADIDENDFLIALPKFASLMGLAVNQYFGKSVAFSSPETLP